MYTLISSLGILCLVLFLFQAYRDSKTIPDAFSAGYVGSILYRILVVLVLVEVARYVIPQ